MDLESCPICWRPFSAAVVPVCLSCGHSCCQDCLGSIRSCPLCRMKISVSFPKKPNYSLLTVLDKVSSISKPEQASQQTQTDLDPIPASPAVPPPRTKSTKPSLLEDKEMLVTIKRTGIMFTFKYFT